MFRKLANQRAPHRDSPVSLLRRQLASRLACSCELLVNLPFLGSVDRLKCIAHDILGHPGSSRLAVIASRAEVNAGKDTRIYDFGKCRRKVRERTYYSDHDVGTHAEGSCFAKVVRKHGCGRATDSRMA